MHDCGRDDTVAGVELPETGSARGVNREQEVFVCTYVRTCTVKNDSGRAILVARLPVAERHTVHRSMRDTRPPPLDAVFPTQPIQESVVGLKQDIAIRERRSRANRTSSAEAPLRGPRP